MVEARLRQKMEQTRRSDGSFPVFVVVVEFGAPGSRIAER